MAVREKTDYIVIHCSDTPDDRDVDMETIKQWHVEDNGWSDIGYHFVIKRNGIVQIGRPIQIPGAHVKGKNSVSVGVCLVGRTEFDERQFSALRDTVQLLLRLYPDSKVVGHHDIDDSKTCPNFNVAEWFTSTSPSIDRP
tara:strand:+ start:11045 stop:11464 length:420 start_codon:yes stop_codon:yes gene_type:complete